MTIRSFFARHRIASGLVAPVALGVAALVAVPWSMSSAPSTHLETVLTASTTECYDMVTVSIAGRGDTPREGSTAMLVDANGNPLPAAMSGDYASNWLDPVVNAPGGKVTDGSYAAMYIAYPADMASYQDAVDQGVANTQSVMQAIRTSCPDTQFAITGYSEGADVARRVAQNIGNQQADENGGYAIVDPASVVGVVILSDAGRTAGDGTFPGAENPYSNPDGFGTVYQDGTTAVPGQGALADSAGGFGALDGRVASFCSDGDLFCSAPENVSLLQLAVNVGRQLDVDALEREGLTEATGPDVAVVVSRMAFAAFAEIQSQPGWMQGDQTFLEVLLEVSDPSYTGPDTTAAVTKPAADSISGDEASPLAYLPEKMFKEIVGLIATNQNTIPVVMSDPYQLTLGPDTGHHFDYWRDADAANGKELTSAEYAAAWLTHLAQQAQDGKKIDTASKPDAASIAAVLDATTTAEPTPAARASTPVTTTTTKTPQSTPKSATSSTSTTTPAPTSSEEAAAPSSTTTQPSTTTTTTAPTTTTTTPVKPAG
ncbi:cutinase family protein [Rhodococcus sp. HNM0569]|uniref:cutinase family protein n=1 Tax=Rhodococcus sp. HNM0569 TaxID=2716340 RepID=UPI001469ECAD|nr:cutinase family protein [Rhodococcus sp. HNM0569]NLU84290.1 cutinase family protein [Rhodococcus sp. HNM0569]